MTDGKSSSTTGQKKAILNTKRVMGGSVKLIYFVAEAQGPMLRMKLWALEQTRIEYARKFFTKINCKIDFEHMKYDCYQLRKAVKVIGMGLKT